MINGAAEEHEEHAEQETNDSERHLPANIGCEPHKPDAAQSKDGSTKVGKGVSPLPAPPLGECFGPKRFTAFQFLVSPQWLVESGWSVPRK